MGDKSAFVQLAHPAGERLQAPVPSREKKISELFRPARFYFARASVYRWARLN
jgi:hypothetical protein